jgi:tetratricopeptide (TPR) repeat protein
MVAKVITIIGIVVIGLLRTSMGGAEAGHDPALQQAIELFNAKRYSASQAVLAQLVDRHRDNATAHYYLGRIYLQAEAYDQAIAHCRQAATLQTTEAEHHFCLGISYGYKARQAPFWQQAVLAPKIRRALEKAVSLDPTHVQARIGLARFYLQAPALLGGDLNKAHHQAEALLPLDASAGRELMAKVAAARGMVPSTN